MPSTHPAVQLLLISGLTIFWLIPLSSWLMLRGQRDVHANLWFFGTGVYSVVVTLFVFARFLSDWVTGPLTATLSLVSVLFMLESIRREISTRPVPWRLYVAATAGLLLALSALLEWGAQEAYWRVLHMVVISSAEIYLVTLINQVRRQHHSKSLWVVMATFLVFVASNMSRALEWWITGRYSILLEFTLIGNISLTIHYLSAIFYCYGYWGFVVEKNRKRLVEATEQAVTSREREKLALVGKHAQSGALSASIAHELNQPLAAIQLNIEESQRMVQSLEVPPALPSLLERIKQDNQRAAVIVRRVRNMFSQGPLRRDSLVLDDIVRAVAEWMHQRLVQAKVQLDLQLNAPTPFAFASGEMEHILMNLLDNAVYELQPLPVGTGRITLRTWREPGWVCLSVTDNGPGVADHMKESIFELSETSKPDGMGLGLWLARYLVERHGGQLRWVQPATVGACFELRLPEQ